MIDESELEKVEIEKPRIITPTKRQSDFISLPDTIFEALYGGELGGGKTFCLVYLPVARRFHEHYAFKGILFRRTFPELEAHVIPLARLLYEPLGAKYNEGKHYFKFPSGARIYLRHLEQENDVRSHDTNEYHYVGVDQAEQFTEFQLRYITSRIRTAYKGLPKLFRLSANPGGISHKYLLDKFIKPAPLGYTILNDPRSKTKRIFIPARLEDNPYLLENDPDYTNRINIMPEKERRAKRGDWLALTGEVFTEFRQKRVPGEPENALHVIDHFEIPEWWPKILAIDWGYTAFTCCLWGAISPDDRIFIYREFHENKISVANWASSIARLSQFDGNIKRIVLDPSAWQNRGDELTIALQFEKYSKFIPERADNDRLGGKNLIHDLLRFIQKEKRYIPPEDYSQERFDRIFRIYGLQAAKDYSKLFSPEPEEKNLPRLQIFKNCINTIEQIAIAQYDEKHIEDVAAKGWQDDAYDALRYLLKASDHYLREVTREHEIRKTYAEVERIRDSDPHSFYMRMIALDRKRNSSIQPTKLYH